MRKKMQKETLPQKLALYGEGFEIVQALFYCDYADWATFGRLLRLAFFPLRDFLRYHFGLAVVGHLKYLRAGIRAQAAGDTAVPVNFRFHPNTSFSFIISKNTLFYKRRTGIIDVPCLS
jgi:hypothetical protein